MSGVTMLPGNISNYLVLRYGFNDECKILPFTGDNPASLAGLNLSINDIGISLGTSDTIFFTTMNYKPCMDAHVFSHISGRKNEFMALVCFKNGSITRERIRQVVGCSWEEYSSILEKTSPGNANNIGFYFDSDEIAPNVSKGDYRFKKKGEEYHRVKGFSAEVEARAVFESQCLLKLLYAKKMGCQTGKGRLYVTGGASGNKTLQQMLSDVFSMNVYAIEEKDSAALGGAMRARYAYYRPPTTYESYYGTSATKLITSPNKNNSLIYDKMMDDFVKLYHCL